MASSYIEGVYAVEVGGRHLPGVQQSTLGRVKNRDTVVVFTTRVPPAVRRTEETVWHDDIIPINVLEVLPAGKAVEKYLYTDQDGSLREKLEQACNAITESQGIDYAMSNLFGKPEGMRVSLDVASSLRGGIQRLALYLSLPEDADYEIPYGSWVTGHVESELKRYYGIEGEFKFEDMVLEDISDRDPFFTGLLITTYILLIPETSTSKEARAPQEIGLPGGPCHIIRDIEEESLPEGVKEDLIKDVERGKSLSNADADKLYPQQRLPAKADLFKTILLTSHAQYRMNLRGVTVRELQAVFEEFDRWYKARLKNPQNLKPAQRKLMSDLAYGEAARFAGNRTGLTIVFAVDKRKREARLVSCWWTDTPNPTKPKPGQCDFVPYLDKSRQTERPAILGSPAFRVACRVWTESRSAAKPGPDGEDDGLNTWFSDKAKGGDWVSISPVKKTVETEDGKKKTFEPGDIVGPCGDPEGDWSDLTDDGDDPLKCLNEDRAKDMTKKERAEAAKAKKKEEKSSPDGQKPTFVDTKQDKESSEIASKVAARVYSQKIAADSPFGWSPEEIARRREQLLKSKNRERPTTAEDLLSEREMTAVNTLLMISRNNLDTHEASYAMSRKGIKSREVQSIIAEVTSDAAIYEVNYGQMHHDFKRHERVWDKLCEAADFDWKREYQRTLEIMS